MDASEDRAWLNEDFKTSRAAVTLCLKELNREEDLPAGSILQIQNVVNVSVPLKAQSESKIEFDPRHHILKISLTDGKESAYAILYEPHSKLSSETPPGTKIQAVRSIPFGSTRILKFSRGNVEVLGGYVEKLVENWRVQKEHDRKSAWGKLTTSPGEEGPPKFKALNPYGRAGMAVADANLRNAKAMDLLEEAKAKSENTQGKSESKTEFDMQRQEAILDLAKQAASKKTFSVSKQFPQSEPQPVTSMPKERRERKTSYQKSNEDPGQEPTKPRFQNRKAKYEEEELLSQYTYRGGQHSLTEHFSDFFGNSPKSDTRAPPNAIEKREEQYHRSSDMDGLVNEFGRMSARDDNPGPAAQFRNSHTFYRGGGGRGSDSDRSFSAREPDSRQEFRQDKNFGDGFRGRSRGGRRGGPGRGRGRGRGSYADNYRQEPPPRTNPTFVPDLSSFPTLGVEAHYAQKY